VKNYIQPGNTITLTAPYAVVSGDGLLVGSIFGIAAGDAAVGEPVETALVGVTAEEIEELDIDRQLVGASGLAPEGYADLAYLAA